MCPIASEHVVPRILIMPQHFSTSERVMLVILNAYNSLRHVHTRT